jgi:DNA invertase Pin-like site-specific DNA recombinase
MEGAEIDTTTAAGKLIFGIFAALAEFERELIVERTKAGLVAARARGRNGGRPYKMTAAKVRLAQAAMGQAETKVEDLCLELGVTRQTLYRHVAPDGSLRADGQRLLERKRS